jgi:acyl carrier protein
MIPDNFYFPDSYPISANGKIDRKMLLSTSYTKAVTPVTEKNTINSPDIENHLIQIWKKLLKIESIELNSSFFDLGGHSLLLPVLKSEIESISGNEIEMLELFKHPTIASQLELVSGSTNEKKRTTANHDVRSKMRKAATRNRRKR